jgi:hypothetical protein
MLPRLSSYHSESKIKKWFITSTPPPKDEVSIQKYVAVAYSILAINEARSLTLRDKSRCVFTVVIQDHRYIDRIAAPYSSRYYQ